MVYCRVVDVLYLLVADGARPVAVIQLLLYLREKHLGSFFWIPMMSSTECRHLSNRLVTACMELVESSMESMNSWSDVIRCIRASLIESRFW